MQNLLNAVTANAASPTFTSTGKIMTLIASGSFGGGTLTLQASADEEVWVNSDIAFTQSAIANFHTGRGVKHRVNLTGATTPSLTAHIIYEQ